jgi:cyclopropane fatty-acyl-phospholipid synthase-like methyltransferase
MWVTKIDNEILDRLNKTGKVLDFGCGDGGYSRLIKDSYDEIHLFDYPEMIKDIPNDIKEIENVTIFSDWNLVKNNKYDEVIATLVFQHNHPKDLEKYLYDISKMTNRVVIKSRLDFNPYLRKELSFKDDFVLPYIGKYFDVMDIRYDGNIEIFIAVLSSKNTELNK